jgi:hypothetical protein
MPRSLARVAGVVALLCSAAPFGAALAVAWAGGRPVAPLFALAAVVAVLSFAIAFGRGRFALGVLPPALVLHAAALPESVRVSTLEPLAWIAVLGLALLAAAVLGEQRAETAQVPSADMRPAARTPTRWPWHVRGALGVALLAVPAALALWLPAEPEQRPLAVAAVFFGWSLVWYLEFVAPRINADFERVRDATRAARDGARGALLRRALAWGAGGALAAAVLPWVLR